MDMNDDFQAPPAVDEAPAGAPPADDQQAGKDPAYRGAEVRCYNCSFFKDPSTCTKNVNGGTVDPEGGCNLFKMADDQGGADGSEEQGGNPNQ